MTRNEILEWLKGNGYGKSTPVQVWMLLEILEECGVLDNMKQDPDAIPMNSHARRQMGVEEPTDFTPGGLLPHDHDEG